LAVLTAIRRALSRVSKPSAKLFDERVSRHQIGKAPAIIDLVLPKSSASMSRLNVSRLMKLNDPAAQFDIQSVDIDGKLDDVGIFALIGQRPAATRLTTGPSRLVHLHSILGNLGIFAAI
jgi:hypothetical protein